MPRPLPPGGWGRLVAFRFSTVEERLVREVADAEHAGNLSAAIRALLAEAIATRQARTGSSAAG